MHRVLQFVACLLVLVAIPVWAQDAGAAATGIQVSLAGTEATTLASQASSIPRPVHHCCHLKGFLIGAGIGAGAGWLLVRYACDASDCTRDYLQYMLVLGGIGGGLGAFLDQQSGLAQPPQRPA